MPEREAPPVRVGVVGLGRHGRRHLERMCLRRDYEVVAAAPTSAAEDTTLFPNACRVLQHWEDVVDSLEPELIVVDAPELMRAKIVRRSLESGKHVAADQWVSLDPTEVARLLDAAAHARRALTVLQERLWDGEFRTAQAAVTTSELGALRAIRLLSSQPALVEREQRFSTDASTCSRDALLRWMLPAVDQLVHLVHVQPATIFAERHSSPPRAADGGAPAGFSAAIRFDDGTAAHLDVHRAAGLSYESGWIVSGTRGGYRHGRLYRLLPDGELFDVPFEPRPTDFSAVYDTLVRRLREDAPLPTAPRQLWTVSALFDAAWRSLQSGRPESVGPLPSTLE